MSTTDSTPPGDLADTSLQMIRGAAFALGLISGVIERSPDFFVARKRAARAADLAGELARDGIERPWRCH